MLSIEDEAIIVAFRKHTRVQLDDCLYALQATIPHLTRSSLRRCLERHGISQLPDVEYGKTRKPKFKAYPIGHFHIDIAEVRTQEGRLYLFAAIDRASKFDFTARHEKAAAAVSREFLLHRIATVAYKIHTALTDNGLLFTDSQGTSWTAAEIKELIAHKEPFCAHAFVYTCAQADIDQRLTKTKHPWTNGYVERMNRTIKEATEKRFYYETCDQHRSHLADFVSAYNFAKRLKTLESLTPYEYICKLWTKEPD